MSATGPVVSEAMASGPGSLFAVLSGLGSVAFVAIPVALIVVVGIVSHRREQARRAALQAWATSRGLTFTHSAPWLVDRWEGVPFGRGRSRRAENAVEGTWDGRPFCAFEYRYSESQGSGKNRRTVTYRFVVVALGLPARLPRLELLHDGVFSKVAGWFGAQDLEFESHDFNQRWIVKADDPKFASDVLHPRAQELLLAGGGGRELRTEGTDLLCWTRGRLDPPEVEGRVRFLADLVELVPRFVWLDHGYDPDGSSRPEPPSSSGGDPS